MASIRIFMFSYDLLCTECPTGIEGRVLPLWRSTALRLNLDESIKSRQSRGMWLILSVCIRPSISAQATRPLSILKNWTRSSYLLWYTEILTFRFRKFHCCSLEPNRSTLHLGKSRSPIRSFNSSCVIWWNLLVKSASIDDEGCGVFSRFSVGSSPESKIYCCRGTGKGKSAVWGTGRITDGINWSTHKMYSVTKRDDSSSIQFYALSHTSCIMTTGVKNWILRPYLDSAHLIEGNKTISVTDTFCVLISVICITV